MLHFENVGVGTTNSGLLLIGDEVITYTNVTGNTIGGNIVRGRNPKTYPAGTPVFKYELSGVSLGRINKTHSLADVTESDPFTFDSYKIKLDVSETRELLEILMLDFLSYPSIVLNLQVVQRLEQLRICHLN